MFFSGLKNATSPKNARNVNLPKPKQWIS